MKRVTDSMGGFETAGFSLPGLLAPHGRAIGPRFPQRSRAEMYGMQSKAVSRRGAEAQRRRGRKESKDEL